jgi:hypothetical protein
MMVTGKNSGAPLLTSLELMRARVNDLFTVTTELLRLKVYGGAPHAEFSWLAREGRGTVGDFLHARGRNLPRLQGARTHQFLG